MKTLRVWYCDDIKTGARIYRTWGRRSFVRIDELRSSICEIDGITDVFALEHRYLMVFMSSQSDRDFLWAVVQPEIARCIAGNISWGPQNPIKGVVFKRLLVPQIMAW